MSGTTRARARPFPFFPCGRALARRHGPKKAGVSAQPSPELTPLKERSLTHLRRGASSPRQTNTPAVHPGNLPPAARAGAIPGGVCVCVCEGYNARHPLLALSGFSPMPGAAEPHGPGGGDGVGTGRPELQPGSLSRVGGGEEKVQEARACAWGSSREARAQGSGGKARTGRARAGWAAGGAAGGRGVGGELAAGSLTRLRPA